MHVIDPTKFIQFRKMETFDEIDKLSRFIVCAIQRECKTYEKIIDENFCIYYTQLLILNPKWGILPEGELDRAKIFTFIKSCVDNLMKDRTFHETLRCQFAFMLRASGKTEMIHSQREETYKLLAPLKSDIIDAEFNVEDKLLGPRLYKKIIIYCIVLSGLGNPLDPNVMREATLALESIMDEEDVFKFIQRTKEEKENNLHYLSTVVAGIRIFNMMSGQLSFGVVDLLGSIYQALFMTDTALQKELVQLMEKVNILTTAIEKCYKLEGDENDGYKLTLVNKDLKNDWVEKLTFLRQYELYIRKILRETEAVKKEVKRLDNEELKAIHNNLSKLVKFKVAIPIHQVFPLFYEVAIVGYKIQDEAILLSKFDKLYFILHDISKRINFENDVYMAVLDSDANEILTDAKRLKKTTGTFIKQKDLKCEVTRVETVNFEEEHLQYLGFCPWALVESDGGLLPGNPNMGLLRWNDRLYAFSSMEAAITFGKDPEKYIMRVMEIARSKIDLIQFMQLHSDLIQHRDQQVLYEKPPVRIQTNSIEVQTELHPIPTNIDPNYMWNVWDLYRDALHWTNISECVTHSTQTYHSHWRAPQRVQTTDMIDKNLQTKTDNYTNVPTLSNFIFGLRGRTDDIQHIIELTRPVHE